MGNTYEKLQKLMNSYVPEFAYQKGDSNPGAVLTDLCGEMIEQSEKRYAQVVDKHRIQYLNLFDAMLKEPVSAARGYVQFHPVTGHEGMVYVPKGTQVQATGMDNVQIMFETEHDISAIETVPEIVAVTDRKSDSVIKNEYHAQNPAPFYGFDVRGENQASHRFYLCFDELFTWMERLDVYLDILAVHPEEQDELLKHLSSSKVCWTILEPDGNEQEIQQVSIKDGCIHLYLPGYVPKKTAFASKEGYVLCVSAKETMNPMYIESVKCWFDGEKNVPDFVYLNGIEEHSSSFLPFGKPLGLYQEFSFEDKEVLSRKGAEIEMRFHLSYQLHEEQMEIPEFDTEYKAIMKKPRKPLAVHSIEVSADYVLWEYLSESGWKRLFSEESVSAMFNGSAEGEVKLHFRCPDDMAEYAEGSSRVRARLLRAEHIYQMPAVYRCPVIRGFSLRYSYKKNEQTIFYAETQNNFEIKDVTEKLQNEGSILPFYQTEHTLRAMYLGFSAPVCGYPFSLYFDIVN